jgi:hypothetical protein
MSVAPSALPPLRPRRSGGRCGGFTLIEVTSAAFVLVFAVSSALLAMQSGFRAIDLARGTTLVSQVLQSEIETVRLMSWGDIDRLPLNTPLAVRWSYDAGVPVPAELTIVKTVTTVPVAGEVTRIEPDLRHVTVTASWRTVDGRLHSRATSTQYCKNGLNDYYASAALP